MPQSTTRQKAFESALEMWDKLTPEEKTELEKFAPEFGVSLKGSPLGSGMEDGQPPSLSKAPTPSMEEVNVLPRTGTTKATIPFIQGVSKSFGVNQESPIVGTFTDYAEAIKAGVDAIKKGPEAMLELALAIGEGAIEAPKNVAEDLMKAAATNDLELGADALGRFVGGLGIMKGVKTGAVGLSKTKIAQRTAGPPARWAAGQLKEHAEDLRKEAKRGTNWNRAALNRALLSAFGYQAAGGKGAAVALGATMVLDSKVRKRFQAALEDSMAKGLETKFPIPKLPEGPLGGTAPSPMLGGPAFTSSVPAPPTRSAVNPASTGPAFSGISGPPPPPNVMSPGAGVQGPPPPPSGIYAFSGAPAKPTAPAKGGKSKTTSDLGHLSSERTNAPPKPKLPTRPSAEAQLAALPASRKTAVVDGVVYERQKGKWVKVQD